METKDIFAYLVNDVHRTVVATVDAECNPITTGLDLLDYDETTQTEPSKAEEDRSRRINHSAKGFAGASFPGAFFHQLAVKGKYRKPGTDDRRPTLGGAVLPKVNGKRIA